MMNLIIYERKQTNYQIVFVCWLMVTLMVAKEKYHRICQTGFLKSPLTLWEVSKTQWPKNLCWKSMTKGQRCEICFRISFVILQRWVDISFHAITRHGFPEMRSDTKRKTLLKLVSETKIGFLGTFQDISLEQCWFFSWDKSFIEQEKAVKRQDFVKNHWNDF